MKNGCRAVLMGLLCATSVMVHAFEGRIEVSLIRGGQTQTFTYTVGTNRLLVARNEMNRPYAKNLVSLDTGEITLLFPHNRSFVRLKPPEENTAPAGFPEMSLPRDGLAPGVGPHPGVGGVSGVMPAMPMMPAPSEQVELKATGDTTNILGYVCMRYTLEQRGAIMEIWATDQLLPFHAWLPNQPPRFGPRRMEERWGELLKAQKLFPLLATLKLENGTERLRFEVTSITSEKIEDPKGELFKPPPDYQKIEPLPF